MTENATGPQVPDPPRDRLRIGIDLGGTKIEILALGEEGREVLRRRVPTPQQDYPAILNTLEELILETESTLHARGTVGLGTPGALSLATGLIKNANSTCLNGQPLQRDLEARLGREIRIANDANCFTLSEAVDGAGAGAEVVFGVILGTGVGGGIVVKGQVLRGANAIAGEWGHNPLPSHTEADLPLPHCYCGRRGCIETYLSGPGLEADHQRTTGCELSAPEIEQQATVGEPTCEASITRYEERLARGLAHVINILDPDVIVLGGGLSRMKRLYRTVPELWQSHVFSDRMNIRLLPNVHGDSSGVRGAAWLWGVFG
ncbi:MAG: ROK family protein [Holophagaceae bacterium]|nr:ROK family protein [Holophagaceae bacterium]